MKKLLLAIAAIAAVSFVSCDTKTATDNNQATDSVFTIEKFTEAIPTLQDSAAVADLMAKANDQVQKFLAAGDTVQALDLVGKIKEVIETNKDKLVALVPTITEFAGNAINLPEDLKAIEPQTFMNDTSPTPPLHKSTRLWTRLRRRPTRPWIRPRRKLPRAWTRLRRKLPMWQTRLPRL